jgi:hypothetical protein|tara:strand:+ start:5018 stop:5209 length:192 start_codon:yes stop_codon:yes gene_type:complete
MQAILLKALTAVLTKLLASFATEALLEWVLFKIAHVIVEHTDTPHDDEFLVQLESIYGVTNKE